MRIFVLGKSGMLGRYVYTYLKEQGYTVIGVGRDEVDASDPYGGSLEKYVEEKIGSTNYVNPNDIGDVVINCMGTIKPRVDELGDTNAILVNSLFPRKLADLCKQYGIKLIHPTTDCVYTGSKGDYNENDPYDVSDVYGMSKALGEPSNCTVIRTSIIGEEVGQGRSLVEWVKGNKGGNTNGYLNHYWNGVTCLQFGKIVETMIEKDLFWDGIKHLHSDKLDKQVLSELINDSFGLGITITPKTVEKTVDRSMATIYTENQNKFNIPTLKVQIQEMAEFHNTLFSMGVVN
jgi:dTDP-4-dehydrorhamnose reductase